MSHLFRFGELLNVHRATLRSMVAVACAANGDVLSALAWCKDVATHAAHPVFEGGSGGSGGGGGGGSGGGGGGGGGGSGGGGGGGGGGGSGGGGPGQGTFPTGASGSVSAAPRADGLAATVAVHGLRSVATALTAYTVAHPGVFALRSHSASVAAKSRARAQEHAEALLRQALCACTDVDLGPTLALWQGADVVTHVLAKSEIGEYGRLWEAEAEVGADSGGGSGGGGGGSSSSGGGHAPATVLAAQDAARAVHPTWVREACMVLKTSTAMAQATRFTVALQVRPGRPPPLFLSQCRRRRHATRACR
jgi:hypothetical protein